MIGECWKNVTKLEKLLINEILHFFYYEMPTTFDNYRVSAFPTIEK